MKTTGQRWILSATVSLAVTCAALVTHAQPAEKVFRIGVLFNSTPIEDMSTTPPRNPNAAALVEGLESRGWKRGRNIEILWRSAEQRLDRRAALIEELVRVPVDVLVVVSEVSAKIAMEKSRTIPIVMATSKDPVGAGVAASLARPGGNVTGVTHEASRALEAKRLSLLKEIAPGTTRVAFPMDVRAGREGLSPEVVAASRALDLTIFIAGFETGDQIESAIDDAVRQGANALYVLDSRSSHNIPVNRKRIQQAAIRHRLPVMYGAALDGALISYATPVGSEYRRAAHLVDRILRGAKPGEIPIEQPTEFQLIVNLKVAKEIGLAIPSSIVLQADRVID